MNEAKVGARDFVPKGGSRALPITATREELFERAAARSWMVLERGDRLVMLDGVALEPAEEWRRGEWGLYLIEKAPKTAERGG